MTSKHKMQNNHLINNPFNPEQPLVFEGLDYKDLDGLMKPTIHVDEFSAKMGDDKDIIVVSFFVRDKTAARDLMAWFEKGYDFVLDADKSPGEIKPGRYLVYIEIRRRSTAPGNIQRILNDLNTLTEFEASDWTMHYNDQKVPWDEETFARLVPLTPNEYQSKYDSELNEWRVASGIPAKRIYEVSNDVKAIQAAAGII